ncbi:MAG: hypothetical protein M5U34_05085 [Chloroflexi bacterium]|nr:hypothetical protein [Chloroflexota bacterium]
MASRCAPTFSDSADSGGTAASVSIPSATGKGKGLTVTAKVVGESGNDLSVTIKTEDEKAGTFTMTVGSESKSGLTTKKGEGYVGDAEFAAVTVSDTGTGGADGAYQLEGGGTPSLAAKDYIGDVVERTGLAGLEALDDVRLVICPDLMAGYRWQQRRQRKDQSGSNRHDRRLRTAALPLLRPDTPARTQRPASQRMGANTSTSILPMPPCIIPGSKSLT